MADMHTPESRLSRAGSIALLIAVVYSAALVVAGFLVPMYSSLSVSSSGEVAHGSATLVAVNGLGGAFVLAIPLLVTLAVWAALRHRAQRGAMPVAWTLTGLLAVFNLAALMSIGLFVIPATVALVVACRKYPPRPKQQNAARHSTATG